MRTQACKLGNVLSVDCSAAFHTSSRAGLSWGCSQWRIAAQEPSEAAAHHIDRPNHSAMLMYLTIGPCQPNKTQTLPHNLDAASSAGPDCKHFSILMLSSCSSAKIFRARHDTPMPWASCPPCRAANVKHAKLFEPYKPASQEMRQNTYWIACGRLLPVVINGKHCTKNGQM